MESVNVYMFSVTAIGALYMLQHGLLNAKVIETVTGAAFGLISLAVFFGTNMHVTTLIILHRWLD